MLPIALMFAGYSIAAMRASIFPNDKKKGSTKDRRRFPLKMQLAIFFLLATNVPMALYMSLVHQVFHYSLL